MPADTEPEFLAKLRHDPSDDAIAEAVKTIAAKYPRDVGIAVSLAWVLAQSGKILSFTDPVVADVASTGGPTSLSTLLPQFFLRAAGAKVPKLGVSGSPVGAIDSLAQIPGFCTSLSGDRVRQIVEGPVGHAHFLAGPDMAPLDGRMFRIRINTGTVAVDTLTAGSLLSNKLAVGITYTGLDIRVYSQGNFGTDDCKAAINKEFYAEVAKRLGITARPVLTSLGQPYQPYFGRREALLALDCVFRRTGGRWLSDHVDTCRSLAAKCLPDHLYAKVVNVSADELRWHFEQNLLAQGAKPADFDALVDQTRRDHSAVIRADHAGYCLYQVDKLSDQVIKFQTSVAQGQAPFPDPVGLVLLVEPGAWIESGTPIATIRATKDLADAARQAFGAILNEF